MRNALLGKCGEGGGLLKATFIYALNHLLDRPKKSRLLDKLSRKIGQASSYYWRTHLFDELIEEMGQAGPVPSTSKNKRNGGRRNLDCTFFPL